MHPVLRSALLNQVRIQCQFALWASEELRAPYYPVDRAFYAIHNVLSASGNLSKALWGLRGNEGKFAAVRKPIRDLLGVADTSPLYPMLSVRNGFEHYDERVTDFVASTTPFVIDLNIGPGNIVAPPRPMLRHFDPSTGDVSFVGTTFNIPAVLSEVKRILPLATEALNARP